MARIFSITLLQKEKRYEAFAQRETLTFTGPPVGLVQAGGERAPWCSQVSIIFEARARYANTIVLGENI